MSKLLTFKEKIASYRDRFFPERQLFLRSEGRVRFLTIGTNTQIFASAVASGFLVWGMITSYAYVTRDSMLEEKNQTISSMSADYQNLSSNFSALEVELERRAAQLEERQRFLEEVVGPVGTDPLVLAPVSDDAALPDTSASDAEKISLLDTLLGSSAANAAELNANERRTALVGRLQSAEKRQRFLAKALLSKVTGNLNTIDTVFQKTELTQEEILAVNSGSDQPMGGPYAPEMAFQPVFTADDSIEFSNLLDEWQRLQIVTFALNSMPVGKPADKYYISSRFGRRRDPIRKTWAKHSGIDLAGWPGTNITATAPGEVVQAGWYGPYGKMVEIDHGNGFKTRYGHMRKLHVKKGDTVLLGQKVGEMGKTGRVTDTHLHYEIWFDGKVRDPLPFMKATNDVLKIQGRHEKNS